MYVLVLGLDVLGNPFGLIRGLSEGVEALFYEPFQVLIFYLSIGSTENGILFFMTNNLCFNCIWELNHIQITKNTLASYFYLKLLEMTLKDCFRIDLVLLVSRC